jgi:hypothetical protein
VRRPVLLALAVAAVALAGTGIELVVDSRHAAFAYLAAFGVGLSGALGGLLFLMIAHVSQARWFVALRRLAEAMAATLPLLAILFLPIALRTHALYPWARPLDTLDADARHAVLARGAWFHPVFFLVRACGYFAIWIGVATLLRRASVAEDSLPRDRARSLRHVERQRAVSGLALPPVALSLTFAAFDWFMSIDATWASDMYGVYFFAGGLASAVGMLAIVAWLARLAGALPAEVSASHFHALGRVLFTAVLFWAYIAFCQLLLVWIADLPREIGYYADRVEGGFAVVSALLAVGHFGLPFFALLSRRLKRSAGALAFVGGWIVAAHALDVYWLVVPALGGGLRWLDAAPILFIVASCAGFGAWRYFAALPVPAGDPHLAQSLRYESP